MATAGVSVNKRVLCMERPNEAGLGEYGTLPVVGCVSGGRCGLGGNDAAWLVGWSSSDVNRLTGDRSEFCHNTTSNRY